MKRKIALAVLTASFYVAFPVFAQNPDNNGNHGTGGNHGEGNNGNHNGRGHGNNSNHSGHDDDGNSAGHRQDRPHGFGDHDNLVLASTTITASVAAAVSSVTADLKSTTLTTAVGTPISAPAQVRAYALMSGTAPSSNADMIAALSIAGDKANALVPGLVQSFGALRLDASRLPATVAQYNDFTKAASSEFIANPPAEFIAIHAALARLIAAAATAK